MLEDSTNTGAPKRRQFRPHAGQGLSQLSLVETALCPLDTARSMSRNFTHEASYGFTDKHRNRKQATAQIYCPRGLSSSDELYLWGLLALTCSQPEVSPEFCATPHYCLKELGIVTDGGRGGKTYRLFRESVHRLGAVHYHCDGFYDPIHKDRSDFGFGFFSYALPNNPESSRAWRFSWDRVFFDMVSTVGGALCFDWQTYRQLDPASRRLYLYLKKLFFRSKAELKLDVRELCIETIGFSGDHPPWKLKQKLTRCIDTLIDAGILTLPRNAKGTPELFTKRGKGEYSVAICRGPQFDDASTPTSRTVEDSALFEQLTEIGLDKQSIARVLKRYKLRMLQQWIDITLAAKEKKGADFFKKSPAAFLIDNLKAAAAGTRTPPDWWREALKRERQEAEGDPATPVDPLEDAFEKYLQEAEIKTAFDRVMRKTFEAFKQTDCSEQDAKERAEYQALVHLRHKFHKEHPELWKQDIPRAGDLFSE